MQKLPKQIGKSYVEFRLETENEVLRYFEVLYPSIVRHIHEPYTGWLYKWIAGRIEDHIHMIESAGFSEVADVPPDGVLHQHYEYISGVSAAEEQVAKVMDLALGGNNAV